MCFKKKLRFRGLVRVISVMFLFFVVPVWLFMIAMIVDSFALWVLLLVWLGGSYSIAWRVENGSFK